MVIAKSQAKLPKTGAILAELTMAIAVLVIAMLPLAFAATSDARQLRTTYQKAIAREIVDGEIEALAAGEWKQVPDGTHDYVVRANAATNLPKGNFRVIRNQNVLRLEWRPAKKTGIGIIAREVRIK
jgi:hypothetical protein